MTHPVSSIRSVALLGHAGSGKTTLLEALLHAAGAIPAMGSVERGTTVSDFDPQERALGHSIGSSLAHASGAGVELYFVDTPGSPDFAGQAIPALAAVDCALVVIDAQRGIEVTTERMMRAAAARGLCRMIVVNRIDADHGRLPALVAEIRERFGPECLLLDLPAHHHRDVVDVLAQESGEADFDSVADAHRRLLDRLIEEDEELLARFLEDGCDPRPEELHAPFERAMRAGHLVPILFTSATTGAGIGELLHALRALAPDPTEGNPPLFTSGAPGQPGESWRARPDADAPHVLAHVFKVSVDPYLGTVGVFRVHQGTVRKGAQLYVGDSKRPLKAAHLYRVQGKEHVEVDALVPGEIGAVAKADEITFDAVLHDCHDEDHVHLAPLRFPRAMLGLAVEVTRRQDELRLLEVLGKLAAEDPCFRIERHEATHETVIYGLGEKHLRTKLEALRTRFRLELATQVPRVPYRETITRAAAGHCRHKKQTGGAGQFGEVHLRIEPLERGAGFQFVDEVKGGVIPGVLIPAVEKGVRRALAEGVVAGYPVEDVRVTVYDGKTHAVDGKEVAFTIAGRRATIDAVRAAEPILLEPIVALEITAPQHHIGDLAADLSSRRGHITGTQTTGPDAVTILGEVPLAEIADYTPRLKALTGGKGAWNMALSHHAPAPPQVQTRLAESYRIRDDD